MINVEIGIEAAAANTDFDGLKTLFNDPVLRPTATRAATRRDRGLELPSATHVYEKPGPHMVAVKVIDIFGNDTMRLMAVNIARDQPVAGPHPLEVLTSSPLEVRW
jgi:hypothetical protein